MFDAAVSRKPRCLPRNKPDWATQATPLRTSSDKSGIFNSCITGMASVLALAFLALCGCDSHLEPVNNHKNIAHPATPVSQQAQLQAQRALIRGSAHLPKKVRGPVQVMILTKILYDVLSESGTAGHSSNPASEAGLSKSIYPHPHSGQPPLKAAGIDELLRKRWRAIAVEPPTPGKYVLLKQTQPSQESIANTNAKGDKDELVMRASQAFSLFSEEKFEGAKISAQRALNLSQRIVGPDGYVTAKCHRLLFLCAIATEAGALADAESHLQEALRIDEALIKQYTKVASASQWQAIRDRVVAATPAIAQRELLRERCVPSVPDLDTAPDAAVVLLGVYADVCDQGWHHFAKDKIEEAEQSFRKAMEIPISGSAGQNNMFSAAAIFSLVAILETAEQYEEIDGLLEVAEKALSDKIGFGEQSDAAALFAAMRGSRETTKGNFREARASLQRAIAISSDREQAHKGLNGPVVGQAWLDLCMCSLSEGDPERAEAEVSKAVETLRHSLGAECNEVQVAVKVLEEVQRWQGERVWHALKGNFTRRGRLVDVSDDAIVTIRGADATTSVVPLAGLSPEDQEFVQQFLETFKSEQQDPFVEVPSLK